MKLKHSCGVFAVWNVPNSIEPALYGLGQLQHRGEESAGVVTRRHTDREAKFDKLLCMGTVEELGAQVRQLQGPKNGRFGGDSALGHVRYSTTGDSTETNIQPIYHRSPRLGAKLYLAHNGNLTNHEQLLEQMPHVMLRSETDTELIGQLIGHSNSNNLEDALENALRTIQGAFSLCILTENLLIAARDRNGIRPLAFAEYGDGFLIASETCAMAALGLTRFDEVHPGEILIFDHDGLRKKRFTPKSTQSLCFFEEVYFARPDSIIDGQYVAVTRIDLGRQLAKESPVDADIVVCMPESARYHAEGYAAELRIPIFDAFMRRHRGRSFTLPDQDQRKSRIEEKLSLVRDIVKDKRIVVVDDSIVRGNTMRGRTEMLYEAGAKEVHVRIASPPIRHPCHYGIDFPTREELIAHNHAPEQICRLVGATSLEYLKDLGKVCEGRGGRCTACWTGEYPV